MHQHSTDRKNNFKQRQKDKSCELIPSPRITSLAGVKRSSIFSQSKTFLDNFALGGCRASHGHGGVCGPLVMDMVNYCMWLTGWSVWPTSHGQGEVCGPL